jgi:choline dehydrogenase-like flavoprotein
MSEHRIHRIITTPPNQINVEIAVIGSGPGGAITACLLAEVGKNVLLIDEGPFLQQESCPSFSWEEMLQKYRNGGITVAMGRVKVAYVEGRCVGGGSEINAGLYHRTPAQILEEWRRDYEVECLTEAELARHFAACEKDLGISYLPCPAPTASLKLKQGAQALGWEASEVPRCFHYGEESESKSLRGKRQSMSKTYLPRFLLAGGMLLSDTRVLGLSHWDGDWRLKAEYLKPASKSKKIDITAETVFVACGAIQTPALLRRSGIKHNIGDNLKLHPTIKVLARFPEVVNEPDMGVPIHQVKEFSPRFSFGCSISSPPYLALAMADHPRHLHEVDSHWQHMAIYYAMTSGGSGTVRSLPFFRDPLVSYKLEDRDLRYLSDGLRELCRALLAAGAVTLYPSITGHPVIRRESDLTLIPRPLPTKQTNLMSIHLMASCPMGENRQRCAVESFGKVHGFEGLYINDSSILNGAVGVNPQGTIMAYARRNVMKFLEQL